MSIYLDYAAATPMDPIVLRAMRPYFSDKFYNPSATYLAANAVHKDLETARAGVAHWLGAKPGEIIFAAGGTEANNLALRGVMANFTDANLVVSAVEHESILSTATLFNCKQATVDADGIVNTPQLSKLIDDKTVLVSIMYANNEVGTVQPLRQIAAIIDDVKQARRASGNNRPLYLHTDAAQAGAYLDLHAARLGVDLMTINAGKIYGPKQAGALYVASHVNLAPQITGGGQERGVRSGTENVAGVIGLNAALGLVQGRRHQEVARLQKLQDLFFKSLEQNIPQVQINGSRKMRLPNNIHITIPGQDNERLIFQLDEAGILCAAGSACSADKGEPSHVLRAMGLSDNDARASLRFTMGFQTTQQDVEKTINTLSKLNAS